MCREKLLFLKINICLGAPVSPTHISAKNDAQDMPLLVMILDNCGVL